MMTTTRWRSRSALGMPPLLQLPRLPGQVAPGVVPAPRRVLRPLGQPYRHTQPWPKKRRCVSTQILLESRRSLRSGSTHSGHVLHVLHDTALEVHL